LPRANTTRRTSRRPTLRAIEARIKRKLRAHLRKLGFVKNGNGNYVSPNSSKEMVRQNHFMQRQNRLKESAAFLNGKAEKLLPFFASGDEVVPGAIRPRVELVTSGTREADLFRLATLTWSVPVSEGYGRRMRFLVWDDSIGRLMGVIALGDPVFNRNVRDSAIGWGVEDRKDRLVNVMDAYVLGALPPYNSLLCGKLVACLVRTKEVRDCFAARYRRAVGVISGKRKDPSLVMVTTSSSLGRSSVYNRLRLDGVTYFESVGFTSGYGHFHVDQSLFEEMRAYLKRRRHPYCGNNRFGNGPNWKLRAIRASLGLLGMDHDLLHHGINREVFICRLAKNADRILRGENKRPNFNGLLSVDEVSCLALERWVCPRAHRRPEFCRWRREDILSLLSSR
jgi:hypothetical protein